MASMRPKPETYLLLFCLLFSLFLLFLESRRSLALVHSLSQTISDPVRVFATDLKIDLKSLFAFSDARAREERIFQLEKEKSLLLARLASFTNLEAENKNMRRLLDAGLPKDWKFAPAQVVSLIGDNLYLTSDHDPSLGTVVIIPDELMAGQEAKKPGVYIGKVAQKIGGQAMVVLASSADSKIPVIVSDPQSFTRRAAGILEGRGGKVVLEQVLSGEVIREGDLILTSGDAYPKGLFVGTIAKVISGDSLPLQKAEVKVALDVNRLEKVFYISKY